MIHAVALLLAFPLAGEVTARALGLSPLGPVLGTAALILAFLAFPRLYDIVKPTGKGLNALLTALIAPILIIPFIQRPT